MTVDTVPLTKIGTLPVPWRDSFSLPLYIKPHSHPYGDIGPALVEKMTMRFESNIESGVIAIWRMDEELTDPFVELEKLGKKLYASQLHYFLGNSTAELRDLIPNDTNIGVALHTDGIPLVRVKAAWETGHSMGLFKQKPDWKWLPESVFLTLEPREGRP